VKLHLLPIAHIILLTAMAPKDLPADVATWTNLHVVQWLLSRDQKVFVPAVVANNITGKTLLTLSASATDLAKAMTPPSASAPLATSIDSLIEEVKLAGGADGDIVFGSGKDANGKDNEGRLLKHPSGWSYDREYNEWVDYFEAYVDNAVAEHLRALTETKQRRFQITILVFSSLTTLITSTSLTTTFEEAGSADEGALNTTNVVLQIVLLVATLVTTLVSGYANLFKESWQKLVDGCAENESFLDEIMEIYTEQLTIDLDMRMPFKEYQKLIVEKWKNRPDPPRPPPDVRNAAIRHIKTHDTTAWQKAFAMREVEKGSCWCFAGPIELDEPMDDDYDAMLMRFSGEDMGEYTLTPEQFQKDKTDAKRILQKKGIIAVAQKKKLPNGGLARIDESSANLDVSTTARGGGAV